MVVGGFGSGKIGPEIGQPGTGAEDAQHQVKSSDGSGMASTGGSSVTKVKRSGQVSIVALVGFFFLAGGGSDPYEHLVRSAR